MVWERISGKRTKEEFRRDTVNEKDYLKKKARENDRESSSTVIVEEYSSV